MNAVMNSQSVQVWCPSKWQMQQLASELSSASAPGLLPPRACAAALTPESACSQAPQLQASFKGSLKPLRALPVARRSVVTRATCSAEAPKVGTALAAAALAAALSLGSVQAAHADIAGLTPCSESKGFAKRQKKEISSLQKRLKQVRAGPARSRAFQLQSMGPGR